MEKPLGRDFRTVWAASAISFIGDGLTIGAMPLLAASLTRDPRVIGLVGVASSIGWLLLGLFSGVLIDRVHRIGLMWRVNALRMVIMFVFSVFVLTGHVTIAGLFLASLILGMTRPFFDNAFSAAVPELVQPEDLERANSRTQFGMVFGANLLGPPLGAALFVAAAGLPFLLDATSFLVGAALMFWLVRGTPLRVRRGQGPRPAMRAELREGLQHLWSDRIIRAQCLALSAINAVMAGMIAILVLYTLEVLDQPELIYGWLVASFAVGGLIAGVVTPRWVGVVGPGRAAGLSVVGFGLAPAIIGVTSSVAITMVCLVLFGMMSVQWNVVTASYRQRAVPGELLGRVTSAYRMVGYLAAPLGGIGAGLLAHQIGVGPTYAFAGVVLLVVAAIVYPTLSRMPWPDEVEGPPDAATDSARDGGGDQDGPDLAAAVDEPVSGDDVVEPVRRVDRGAQRPIGDESEQHLDVTRPLGGGSGTDAAPREHRLTEACHRQE